MVRYDNEAGKSDHKHIGAKESFYQFESPRRLLDDFWRDVKQWQENNEYGNSRHQ